MKLIRDLFRVFPVLLQWSRGVPRARLSIILVIATGIIAGLSNTALIAVINNILLQGQSASAWLLIAFVGLCILIPISAFSSQSLLVRLTASAGYDIRKRLCERILSTPLQTLEELGMHRLYAALTEDIPAVTNTISSLPVLLAQLAIVAGCLIYMGSLSRPLLLMVVIYMALGIFGYQLPFTRALKTFHTLREEWDALFKLLRALNEGCKELKLHRPRRQAFFSQQLEPNMRSILNYSVRANVFSFAAVNMGQSLFFIFIGLVLFAAPIFFVVDRHALTGYVMTILYMNGPLAAILNTVPNLGRAQVAFKKIEELGVSLSNQMPEFELTPRQQPPTSWMRLELAGITHRYKSEGESGSFILGPLDLTFYPGETVFLTGGNGGGKTTLAKLIVGLYAPEAGAIRLDGKPITDENRDDYRQNFSAIFSDFYLFERLLGLDSEDPKKKAQEYLTQLQLNHRVKIEDGNLSSVNLSSGQRKRLALLVAYLEDRSIYVFDEWAADQDPLFKRVFYYQILSELKARRKTLIVISHDDRYYHLADRIIKIESGQIEFDHRAAGDQESPDLMAAPSS